MKAFFALVAMLVALGWFLGFEVLINIFVENPFGWIPTLVVVGIVIHVVFFARSDQSAKPTLTQIQIPQNIDKNHRFRKVQQQRKLTKSQRKQMVFDLHKEEPEMSVSEVAQRVGVSPQTVKGYYKEMGVDTEKETLLNDYSRREN